jgi:hypothetical protein
VAETIIMYNQLPLPLFLVHLVLLLVLNTLPVIIPSTSSASTPPKTTHTHTIPPILNTPRPPQASSAPTDATPVPFKEAGQAKPAAGDPEVDLDTALRALHMDEASFER